MGVMDRITDRVSCAIYIQTFPPFFMCLLNSLLMKVNIIHSDYKSPPMVPTSVGRVVGSTNRDSETPRDTL